MFTCTEHLENLLKSELDERIKTRLKDTGFPHLSTLANCQHDNKLLNCVVSHFNTKTCGFEFDNIKFNYGLKDVLNITGLHITGKPVTGIDDDPVVWSMKCFGEDLCTQKQRKKRGAIKLMHLRKKFMEVPPDASDEVLDRHARAYVLYVLGSSLFSSGSSKAEVETLHLPLLLNVQEIKDYAWGAAALAHLYCSMKKIKEQDVKHLNGIALSLQVFVFLHLTNIKKLINLHSENKQFPLIVDWSKNLSKFTLNTSNKVDYLNLISTMTADEVEYDPYDNIQFMEEYSTFMLERSVYRESTYLINFNEVAFFEPHKFKKQYRDESAGDRRPEWILYSRTGSKGKNWMLKKHTEYIIHWNQSCLGNRPLLVERQPEMVQNIPAEETIRVEHRSLYEAINTSGCIEHEEARYGERDDNDEEGGDEQVRVTNEPEEEVGDGERDDNDDDEVGVANEPQEKDEDKEVGDGDRDDNDDEEGGEQVGAANEQVNNDMAAPTLIVYQRRRKSNTEKEEKNVSVMYNKEKKCNRKRKIILSSVENEAAHEEENGGAIKMARKDLVNPEKVNTLEFYKVLLRSLGVVNL